MKDSFYLLKKYKYKLTYQQYNTLKGQIKAGDIKGFEKGLFNIINKQIKKSTKKQESSIILLG